MYTFQSWSPFFKTVIYRTSDGCFLVLFLIFWKFWNFAMRNDWFFTTNEFLQRATSATRNERILQRVTSEFLQRATSATSNKRSLQRVTSDFLQWATSATSNERILQRVTSEFLHRATSATSNERILQRTTSATSNE